MREIRVRIETRLNNTEDLRKVVQAVSSIASCGTPELIENEYGRVMVFEGFGKEFLSPLRRLLFEHRILSAARKVLKNSRGGGIIRFCLNKQAAYSGQVSFCEEDGESPLGPLVIEVTTQDADAFLDWLTPSTGDNSSIVR